MTEKQLIEFLRKERQRQGISYRHMAALSGLPQSTIGRFEMFQTRPLVMTMIRYADVLGYELKLEKY